MVEIDFDNLKKFDDVQASKSKARHSASTEPNVRARHEIGAHGDLCHAALDLSASIAAEPLPCVSQLGADELDELLVDLDGVLLVLRPDHDLRQEWLMEMTFDLLALDLVLDGAVKSLVPLCHLLLLELLLDIFQELLVDEINELPPLLLILLGVDGESLVDRFGLDHGPLLALRHDLLGEPAEHADLGVDELTHVLGHFARPSQEDVLDREISHKVRH